MWPWFMPMAAKRMRACRGGRAAAVEPVATVGRADAAAAPVASFAEVSRSSRREIFFMGVLGESVEPRARGGWLRSVVPQRDGEERLPPLRPLGFAGRVRGRVPGVVHRVAELLGAQVGEDRLDQPAGLGILRDVGEELQARDGEGP